MKYVKNLMKYWRHNSVLITSFYIECAIHQNEIDHSDLVLYIYVHQLEACEDMLNAIERERKRQREKEKY